MHVEILLSRESGSFQGLVLRAEISEKKDGEAYPVGIIWIYYSLGVKKQKQKKCSTGCQ